MLPIILTVIGWMLLGRVIYIMFIRPVPDDYKKMIREIYVLCIIGFILFAMIGILL
jgi:hypothetical protein